MVRNTGNIVLESVTKGHMIKLGGKIRKEVRRNNSEKRGRKVYVRQKAKMYFSRYFNNPMSIKVFHHSK